MRKIWSPEHLVRRVDRYYLLAAAAKLPELRRNYIDLARQYRRMLTGMLIPAI